MDGRTTAQLILRGKHGPMRVAVLWPDHPRAGVRPPTAVLFSERWLAGSGGDEVDIGPASGELGLVACWRASRGYAHAVDDACRLVDWAAMHAGELGSDPRRLRVGGTGATTQLVHDVLAHTGLAANPAPTDGLITASTRQPTTTRRDPERIAQEGVSPWDSRS